MEKVITSVARQRGFTLIEVMITLLIVSILVAVALPAYTGQQARARQADCQASLVGFTQALEQHFAINFTYLGAAEDGDNTGEPETTVFPATCPATGTAYYNLVIQAATASSYTLRATPVSTQSQADAGILEINSLGQRFRDRNGDNDTGDNGENSWDR